MSLLVGAPFEREVAEALLRQLPGSPPIKSVEKKALTVADDNGLRKELDPTYLITFGDEAAARAVRLTQVKVRQQDFRLDGLQFGPHRTWLCSNVPAGADGAERAEVLHSLLAMFPGPYLMCVQTATKVGGLSPSTDGFILLTLSEPVDLRFFSLEFNSTRKSGRNIKASFFPVTESFFAPCLVCDYQDHSTERCPKFVTMRLATGSFFHPRIVPGLPAHRAMEAGADGSPAHDQHLERDASLPHRTKRSDADVAVAAEAWISLHGQRGGTRDSDGLGFKRQGSVGPPRTTQAPAVHAPQGQSRTTGPAAQIILDSSTGVDACHCLRNGTITEYVDTTTALVITPYNAKAQKAPLYKRAANKLFAGVSVVGGSLRILQAPNSNLLLAGFTTARAAGQMRGTRLQDGDKEYRLHVYTPPTHNTFICSDIAFGHEGVDTRALLHGLLHLFPHQARLKVKVAGPPPHRPRESLGCVLVTLSQPLAIESFEFSLEVKQGYPPTSRDVKAVFQPVDVGAGGQCAVCTSAAHATGDCGCLTPLLLEGDGGRYGRLRE